MGGFFSRSAQTAANIRNNTPQGKLKSALTQYINAVKKLQGNERTNNSVRGALNSTMFTNKNVTTTNALSKVISNSVANIVKSSSAGLWAAVNANTARETARSAAEAAAAEKATENAAIRLKTAARNASNLNAILSNIFKNVENSKRANAYKNKRLKGLTQNEAAALIANNTAKNKLKRGRTARSPLGYKNRYTNLWTQLTPAAAAPTIQLANALDSVSNDSKVNAINNADKLKSFRNVINANKTQPRNQALTNALIRINRRLAEFETVPIKNQQGANTANTINMIKKANASGVKTWTFAKSSVNASKYTVTVNAATNKPIVTLKP